MSAPENWNEDDRKMFDSLPNEAQDRLLKREKEMTADYTRKTQDLAEQRKELEALNKVLEPDRQNIAATGIGEAEYISRLLNADAAVTQANHGTTFNVNNNGGTSKNGQSVVTLDIDSANVNKMFTVVRSAEDPKNEDLTAAGANIIVTIAKDAKLY